MEKHNAFEALKITWQQEIGQGCLLLVLSDLIGCASKKGEVLLRTDVDPLPLRLYLSKTDNGSVNLWGLSFCFFIFCHVTNFLSSWQKFGHDDKKLVAMTIGIVTWPIFCHRDQNLVTMTIGIVIVTKFWSRWQKIGFQTWIKSWWSSTRILVHWSNPHYHQVCLDIDKIPINIIKDAWTWIKLQ